MTDAARSRFPWILTVVCALALAILVSLGVWQVQRLQWKEGLIREAEAAADLPAVSLYEALGAPGGPEFRKVTVDCPGLPTARWVELRSINDGVAGVRLISACRPDRMNFPILIDRGFVPETISARPPVQPSDAPYTVRGEVRLIPPPGPMSPPAEGRIFYARDIPAMGEALGVGLPAPHTVYATVSTNPDWAALQPSAPPAAFSNNHLGYAATWFGLAIALVGFYIALLRRKQSPQAAALRERGDRAKDLF